MSVVLASILLHAPILVLEGNWTEVNPWPLFRYYGTVAGNVRVLPDSRESVSMLGISLVPRPRPHKEGKGSGDY